MRQILVYMYLSFAAFARTQQDNCTFHTLGQRGGRSSDVLGEGEGGRGGGRCDVLQESIQQPETVCAMEIHTCNMCVIIMELCTVHVCNTDTLQYSGELFEGCKFHGLWVGFLANLLLAAASQSFLSHKFPIIMIEDCITNV